MILAGVTMTNDPLLGARLKIARAKHHINDLNAQANDFFAAHWGLVVTEKPETGERSLFLKSDKTLPEDFGVLIGDAVHNLRSALDHVIWAFVSPHNPRNPAKVQFPFTRDADSLKASIIDRQIDLAGPKVVGIINDARPYKGGSDKLVGLHNLSILDKHKLLTPIASLSFFRKFNIRTIDPAAPEMPTYDHFGGVGFENKSLWTWLPVDPADRRVFESNAKIPSSSAILFAEDQPFANHFVIKTLVELRTEVIRIVDKFEGLKP